MTVKLRLSNLVEVVEGEPKQIVVTEKTLDHDPLYGTTEENRMGYAIPVNVDGTNYEVRSRRVSIDTTIPEYTVTYELNSGGMPQD